MKYKLFFDTDCVQTFHKLLCPNLFKLSLSKFEFSLQLKLVQEETFVGLLLVVACHSWQMYVVLKLVKMYLTQQLSVVLFTKTDLAQFGAVSNL
jgi:hypothetical protein